MIFSKEMYCELCGITISFLKLPYHIKKFHKENYNNYKEQFITKYNNCLICKKPVKYPRIYCSQKCTNIYRSHIKKTNKLSDSFKELSEEKKLEIISTYKECVTSLQELASKYDLPLDIIKMIFKQYQIKQYDRYAVFKHTLKIKAINFMQSEQGKNIIEEYTNQGNLRYLSKKYKICRKALKRLLNSCDIKIKTSIEAKKEIDAIKKEKGIRGYRYGMTSPTGSGKCHWYLHQDIRYQGSWEFKLGLWLLSNGKNFLCHKGVKQFEYEIKGEKHTYCPDFYILKEDCFIEVKGYFPQVDREKMNIIKNLYPDIKIEIYDKERLKKEGILNIDKKLNICIEDYSLNHKTGELYLKEFMESINKKELIRKNIVEKLNLQKLSNYYNIPYPVMCEAFYRIVPRLGTDDYYTLCFKEFFLPEHIEKIKNGISMRECCQQISNGLSYKRNYEIIKRFKEGLYALHTNSN